VTEGEGSFKVPAEKNRHVKNGWETIIKGRENPEGGHWKKKKNKEVFIERLI